MRLDAQSLQDANETARASFGIRPCAAVNDAPAGLRNHFAPRVMPRRVLQQPGNRQAVGLHQSKHGASPL
jgi:hypothetical protein